VPTSIIRLGWPISNFQLDRAIVEQPPVDRSPRAVEHVVDRKVRRIHWVQAAR